MSRVTLLVLVSALLLDALVLALLLLMLTGFPIPVLPLVLLAIIAVAGTVAAGLLLRPTRRPGEPVRLELDRLRPGRLRDACLHAAGYHRQLYALAETFPDAAWRATLQHALPTADSLLRALRDLCLALQAYELGESHPPALVEAPPAEAAARVAEAEVALQEAIEAMRQVYNAQRRAWSDPMRGAPTADPAAALAPHSVHLRDLATIFAGIVAPAESPAF